nr:antibiotic biosynthesis monooxygenase [Alloalcanivorax marinus]
MEGYIVVPEDDLNAVSAALQTHIELTREENGCLRFEVTQNPESLNIFNVYEEFVDRTAFELHQFRAIASVWGAVTANVERYYDVYESHIQ